MKTILMSIKARHNRNIESGLKKSELRLKPPKCELPFKVLTYESGFDGRHKVVNEWICDNITEWRICVGIPAHLPKAACVSAEEIREYSGKGCKDISEMHISDLKIYDKPKELSEFNRPCVSPNHNCEHCIRYGKPYTWDFDEEAGKTFCSRRITRPPQSWFYVEELENDCRKSI